MQFLHFKIGIAHAWHVHFCTYMHMRRYSQFSETMKHSFEFEADLKKVPRDLILYKGA